MQIIIYFLQTYLQILGAMIVVVLMDPVLILPSLVQVLLFFLLRRVYIAASSRIKRYEGTCNVDSQIISNCCSNHFPTKII